MPGVPRSFFPLFALCTKSISHLFSNHAFPHSFKKTPGWRASFSPSLDVPTLGPSHTPGNCCNPVSLCGKLPDAVEELTMRHSFACFILSLTLSCVGACGQSTSPALSPLTVIRVGTMIVRTTQTPLHNHLIFIRQ